MAGKPYQSCLIPFEEEIMTLRQKRPPMSFSKIAEYMQEKHQISVTRQTILLFLKVRAKGFKPCQYVESIKQTSTANQPAIVVSTESKPLAGTQAAVPMPSSGKTTVKGEPKAFRYSYDPEQNLTRLPPEEAAVMRQILEQEENERKIKK